MELKVVELFAGVGGFRVGLSKIKEFDKDSGKAIEKGEWQFVWANQWEPTTKAQPAYDCYVRRFGDECTNIDITKVEKNEIPHHTLLVGGFPCQDYSVARSKSNEKGIEGKKGVLWWEIADIVKEKQTPFILLENVDRLLKSPSKQKGRDFAIMLKTLDKLGYVVQWRVINAGEYGMPQKRKRVFIFAASKESEYGKSLINLENYEVHIINDGFFNDIFDIDGEKVDFNYKDLNIYTDEVSVTEEYNQGMFLDSGMCVDGLVINTNIKEEYTGDRVVLADVVKEANKYQNDYTAYNIDEDKIDKWKYLKGSKRINRVDKNGYEYVYSEGAMAFPDELTRPARTMLTSEGSINRTSHILYEERESKYRILSEVEAELIQMFPANWTNTGMSQRQRYFVMGNALVTGIVSKLEEKLREIILSE